MAKPSEYGASSLLESAPWTLVRWYRPREGERAELKLPIGVAEAEDRFGQRVLLFKHEYRLRYFAEDHPHILLSVQPFGDATAESAAA